MMGNKNAERLRLAMREANMKAVELCARTGIKKSSLSHYMSGKHWPDDNRKVGAMAEALGVNPAWLMGFDEPMYLDDGEGKITALYKKLSTEGRKELLKRAEELLLLESIRKEN